MNILFKITIAIIFPMYYNVFIRPGSEKLKGYLQYRFCKNRSEAKHNPVKGYWELRPHVTGEKNLRVSRRFVGAWLYYVHF